MSHRILIADDEPNIVLSLEFLLRNHGYEVAVARDGSAALELAAAFRPHLLLLDIMIPVVNGFDVCSELRADPLQRNLKILMLTARGRDSEIKRGLSLGADAYVTKPFATRDLITKVGELLTAT